MNIINFIMIGVGLVMVILNSWTIYKHENTIIGIIGQAVLPASMVFYAMNNGVI